jgi:hypothetical protein
VLSDLGTDQNRENRLLLEHLGVKEIAAIHTQAAEHSFVRSVPTFVERRGEVRSRR